MSRQGAKEPLQDRGGARPAGQSQSRHSPQPCGNGLGNRPSPQARRVDEEGVGEGWWTRALVGR